MTGDYWEDEIYAGSLLSELEHSDMSGTFNWISDHFPASGSKVDWSRVRGKHVHWEIHDDAQLVSAVSREVCQRTGSGLWAEHVGDSLSPYGVFFGDIDVPEIVAALLEIPEHHYFLARNRSWIIVATTEGDLDVVDELPSIISVLQMHQ